VVVVTQVYEAIEIHNRQKQVDKPKGAPAWMPDKIWKPVVKKVGTETLE
jgi:hypothetical protein